ncbi:MAG TPA: OsmC family protein [Candidatus Acidoferrales bacterium]|nr:OsmC family protein [Candidatus Acidoferrales bacterium]
MPDRLADTKEETIMEVQIEHLGDLQFQITARTHTIACDQPIENGGFDEGMTPPELFLASLGSCAGFYAAQYLRKQDLATEGTRIRVSAEKAKDSPRLADIRIEVELPVEMSEEHRAGVEDAIHHCLLHNTLLHPPQISIEINEFVSTAT